MTRCIGRCICICCLLVPVTLSGQMHESSSLAGNTIEWTGQYPAAGAREGGLLEKLGALVFGKKTNPVVKPVAAIHIQNDLWILSQGNGFVFRINGGKSSGIAGADQITFPSLVSICAIRDSGVLVTDSFLEQAMFIRTGSNTATPFNNNVRLQRPTGIAYCPLSDQVWIVETGAHRISIFGTDGTYIKSVGERGTRPGTFNFPTHIAMDNLGNAYVVDALNYRIQIFDQKGEFVSEFGKQGISSGSLARPKGIAIDSHGNIYLADALFHCIQVFNSSGELLYYFGKQGTHQEEFWMPSGLFIDQQDKVYVSDTYNNRIQIFQYKNN